MIKVNEIITMDKSKLTSIFWKSKNKINENKNDKKLQVVKKTGGRI